MNKDTQKAIEALSSLSNFWKNEAKASEKWQNAIEKAERQNPFFTRDAIEFACDTWAKNLEESSLRQWWEKESGDRNYKKINFAIISASNLPFVGMHDFVCALMAGFSIKFKPSSRDIPLWSFVIDFLKKQHGFDIELVRDIKTNFDAIIATGSNNTYRYFDYYFSKYPHILRKDMRSVAVIDKNISKEEIIALCDDMFLYYGLGCRSVSKLYLPKGLDIESVLNHIKESVWKERLSAHPIYKDNYIYRNIIYQMNGDAVKDLGFALFVEEKSAKPPIACVYYEYYEEDSVVSCVERLEREEGESLQCVAVQKDASAAIAPAASSKLKSFGNIVELGSTQHNTLYDYADGINTIEFFIKNFAI